jgi:autotransporter-associated beta strand protein
MERISKWLLPRATTELDSTQNSTVRLASGTNTITVTNFRLGVSLITSGQLGSKGSVSLGATNTINANTINVGAGRFAGELKFDTGIVDTGTVTIRNQAGTGKANLIIANQNVFANIIGGTVGSSVDFGQNTVDAQFGLMAIGTVNAASLTSAQAVDVTGTFSFGAGNVTADSVRIGYSNAGAATGPGVTGVFNQNGGTATLTELTVGGDRVTGSGTTGLTGIYNLAGGLLKSGSITTGTGTDYTTRTFNWSGGTIQNLDASTDLTISSGIAFNLSNTGTFNADSGRAIAMSSAIGGSGALVKEGAGTLALSAANTYTGNTTVNAGTLSLGNGTDNSSLADTSAVTIAAGAILDLNFSSANPDTVNELYLGTPPVIVPAGTYNSTTPTYGSYFTGTGSLVVLTGSSGTPYDTWMDLYPSITGDDRLPGADPDNDGLTNQQEFAFGLIPNNGSSVNPILVPLDKTTGTFSYQRRASSGLTYRILTSTDLVSWPEDTAASASQSPGAVDDNGNETVVVTLSGTKPLTDTKLFVRVAAE